MREVGGVRLPVLPVELRELQRRPRRRIEAAGVQRPAVRVGARPVEALHAANPTEQMLRDAGVERVGGQRLASARELEAGCGHDHVDEAGHGADRAGAGLRLDLVGKLGAEPYGAAMAAAAAPAERAARHCADLGRCVEPMSVGLAVSASHMKRILAIVCSNVVSPWSAYMRAAWRAMSTSMMPQTEGSSNAGCIETCRPSPTIQARSTSRARLGSICAPGGGASAFGRSLPLIGSRPPWPPSRSCRPTAARAPRDWRRMAAARLPDGRARA